MSMRALRSNLPVVFTLLVALMAGTTAHAQSAASSGFGVNAQIQILPILGIPLNFGTTPIPLAVDDAPPAYSRRTQVPGGNFAPPILGQVLRVGIMEATATSPFPAADESAATVSIENVQVQVPGAVLPLVTLTAPEINTDSQVSGSCADRALVENGGTRINGGRLGGLLIPGGLDLPFDPPPNLVLFDQLGIRVTLNAQRPSGNPRIERRLEVTAVVIEIDNAPLAGLGLVSGEIALARSAAQVRCTVPL
jgi:hypothetical protein